MHILDREKANANVVKAKDGRRSVIGDADTRVNIITGAHTVKAYS